MSPFGATATAFGCQKYSGSRPPPALPSVIRTLPSGLNLMTWCPFVLSRVAPFCAPRALDQSVTQMLPSRSTYRPCGTWTIPAPNDRTTFPLASNFITGSRLEPMHEFAPHRSVTQTLAPSLSMPTPLVDPQVRPSGIFAQPSTVWYGFG